MATYEHQCTACNQEFELEYKMSDPVPTTCPLCNTEGQVKRLISWSAGKVELSGQELKAHLTSEAKKAKIEARKNENLVANVVGENNYHQYKLAQDKLAKY